MLVDMRSRSITIRVRAFRERSALLSRLAHDVELILDRFVVEESEGKVEVEFEPGSLVVQGALSEGVVDPSILKASDRLEIERNLREMLKTRTYPRGLFAGSFRQEGDSVVLKGALELLGERRDVAWELTRRGDHFVGSLVLEPSRWGIAPYRALLGALKLQDRVEVRMEVAADLASS
jgi:hypothetical protein